MTKDVKPYAFCNGCTRYKGGMCPYEMICYEAVRRYMDLCKRNKIVVNKGVKE